jgi:hypothetical protein
MLLKVKLKVESKWLDLERKSMSKMRRNYEDWERETLQKAKEAADLRDLRQVFYELGDRWEFDQATGAWLEGSEPLDTIGLILRMPGLRPNKERYVVYAVMAYSKGLTDQFDHLGDKERIIVERDLKTGQIQCWSTTGHGLMDLFPTNLSKYKSLTDALDSSYLVAQPGDHALRIETPFPSGLLNSIIHRLWDIAGGTKSFHIKHIDVLTVDDIEQSLDFKFHRYVTAVVDLDKMWRYLSGSAVEWAKERVLDKIPDHIEERDRLTLRKIEGLLHILWFRPPYEQLQPIATIYDELQSEPTPTETQRSLVPLLGELVYSLTDIVEKAKYLKWKSVIDRKSFSKSDVFKGLDLTNIEREAFAAALDDILKEHTLSYIGFPEQATMKNKVMRVTLGSVILPIRLLSSFVQTIRQPFWTLLERMRSRSTSDNTDEVSSKSTSTTDSDQTDP